MPHTILHHVHDNFLKQSMMQTFGAELRAASDGRAIITSPILPGARQQQGYGHAGLTFAIADSAAGYAALSRLPSGADVLTTEMKINLVAPASGDYLQATGQVEKFGRSLIVVSARVEAIEGDTHTLIALLQGTMMPIRP